MKRKGVAGARYGLLTAIRETSKTKGKSGSYKWLFSCVCGGSIIHEFSAVRSGRWLSCGCAPPTRLQRAFLYRERLKISKFEADLLAVRVEGACDVCGGSEVKIHNKTKLTQFLSVDHCHETGHVRGVLCQKCNSAEGYLRGLANARRMVAYLEKAEALAKMKPI